MNTQTATLCTPTPSFFESTFEHRRKLQMLEIRVRGVAAFLCQKDTAYDEHTRGKLSRALYSAMQDYLDAYAVLEETYDVRVTEAKNTAISNTEPTTDKSI
jgi:hypothetical protein